VKQEAVWRMIVPSVGNFAIAIWKTTTSQRQMIASMNAIQNAMMTWIGATMSMTAHEARQQAQQ
jgi:hypothetical protein